MLPAGERDRLGGTPPTERTEDVDGTNGTNEHFSSTAIEQAQQTQGSSAPASSSAFELSNLRSTSQAGGKTTDSTHQSSAEDDVEVASKRNNEEGISGSQGGLCDPPEGSIAASHDFGIGPATDKPATSIAASVSSGPRMIITLLLHSTETRHPYTINGDYLLRRNVSVQENNPVNMSVYTLKELIWKDWRQDWEPRPTSPSSIRLIHMGRLLDDKSILKDSRFSTGDAPHVVHMTIKPQEAIDEEDARMAKSSREREATDRTPRCRCIVM